jgi:hypothetical protein
MPEPTQNVPCSFSRALGKPITRVTIDIGAQSPARLSSPKLKSMVEDPPKAGPRSNAADRWSPACRAEVGGVRAGPGAGEFNAAVTPPSPGLPGEGVQKEGIGSNGHRKVAGSATLWVEGPESKVADPPKEDPESGLDTRSQKPPSPRPLPADWARVKEWDGTRDTGTGHDL